MAVDTPRTLVELLNIFRDGQADGEISEQDTRDLIVSLVPAVGAIYFSTPIETVIGGAGTKVKALGTTSIVASPHGIDMPADNRIRYTGNVDRHFIIDSSFSAQTVGANKVVQYQLYKNGIALPETLMTRAHSGAGSEGVVAMTTSVHMAQNDYIELWVSNETDTTNLTIENGVINLLGFVVE